MSREDPHVRQRALDPVSIAGVGAGGVALIVSLVYLRFCGEATVPAKPPEPHVTANAAHVVKQLSQSTDVYVQGLARDAQRAGVATPTLDDMERAFTWQTDDTHRTLHVGDPAIDVAGLHITAVQTQPPGSEPLFALEIENPGTSPVAYDIETRVSTGDGPCLNRTVLPHNGNVIAAGGKETRSECSLQHGMEVYVDHVESAAIPPLGAYYLGLVAPKTLGENDRISGGHRPALPNGVTPCAASLSQSVRRAIEDGKTRWRDLADFYTRHPCSTYEFPDEYRAFEKDGEKPLPVAGD